DYEMPYSLVFDDCGIYYDPHRPSKIEHILNEMGRHPEHYRRAVERAQGLIQTVVRHGITKYNVGSVNVTLPDVPRDRRVLLVTGQVDGDASVRRGGGDIQSNAALLTTVRKNNPDAYILYLEHPDVASGNRPGKIAPELLRTLANQTLHGIRVLDLLPICDELHVLTSLSGFEALLRGVPVSTYGRPFYAGWGLTNDALTFPTRTAKLSLEQLVAATLILYPRYYDWDTGLFCRCEDVCERMIEKRSPTIPLWVRTIRMLRDIAKRFGIYIY
ncbi:MAG TPA: capsular biosynthesis protein, partial [Candidatus Duodenibacillus intestinavium]|nr:capsular biosynthesis protein [Candidatus Duodenibacillus intestinavium]